MAAGFNRLLLCVAVTYNFEPMYSDKFLDKKLDERRTANAFRSLKTTIGTVDFSSNDYLGISYNGLLRVNDKHLPHGSTGSRLLSGNYALIEQAEQEIAQFHESEAALIFNSGYDANIGLLSSVPQKGDTILFDQLSHASIRDGIRLSFATSFSFGHNNVADLEKKLQAATGNIFVVTEGVFSMDGDIAPLQNIITVCQAYGAHVIVDEAHAIGVVGTTGQGVAQSLAIHQQCFARVYTFGKACGCHGAVVTGSHRLKQYLVNFARSVIFSTSLPPTAIQAIRHSYQVFPTMYNQRQQLQHLINKFSNASLPYTKLESNTAIQGVIVPGNDRVKKLAAGLLEKLVDVRPILYPSVPLHKERLRIVLHAFNTIEQVDKLLLLLQQLA